MDFIYGILGAITALILVFSGLALGWNAKKRDLEHHQQVTARELTEKERRLLEQEWQAWNRMQNYSVEDAYDLHPKKEGSDT